VEQLQLMKIVSASEALFEFFSKYVDEDTFNQKMELLLPELRDSEHNVKLHAKVKECRRMFLPFYAKNLNIRAFFATLSKPAFEFPEGWRSCILTVREKIDEIKSWFEAAFSNPLTAVKADLEDLRNLGK
jgi:hypothetical protein